jgi:hypothetical protein
MKQANPKKKCIVVIAITLLALIIIAALFLTLLFTCVLPGTCLHRSQITNFSSKKEMYTGFDNYVVHAEMGFVMLSYEYLGTINY